MTDGYETESVKTTGLEQFTSKILPNGMRSYRMSGLDQATKWAAKKQLAEEHEIPFFEGVVKHGYTRAFVRNILSCPHPDNS